MRAEFRMLLSISTIAVGMAVMAVAGAALAQEAPPPAPGLPEWTERLRPGDRVTVTTRDLARIRGKLVAVGDAALVLATDSGEQHVPLATLDHVSRRRHGMLLGPIIGAGVGIGFAIPVAMLHHNEGDDATGATALFVGLGAGIGLLIDALVDLPRTVYRRQPPPRVTLAPRVGRDTRALAMQVTF